MARLRRAGALLGTAERVGRQPLAREELVHRYARESRRAQREWRDGSLARGDLLDAIPLVTKRLGQRPPRAGAQPQES